MGLTGELMKSVFSKGRPDMNGGRFGFRFGEKRKQGGVRSYLCGREFGLVPAEEDSASLQPLPGMFTVPREKHNSISQLFREQDAAITIQTAFRSYMARNQRKEETANEGGNHLVFPSGRDRRPNVESTNTSLEVHSAKSVQLVSGKPPARELSSGEYVETPSECLGKGWSLQADRSMVYPQKRNPRIRVLPAKEEWDDSTFSSNVAEMRIKRRLKAVAGRERALAYAFSQQLRVCSRKRPDREEPNAGWSWLERWMATRPSENLSPLIPLDGNGGAICFKQQCGKTRRKLVGEEKESCGLNEVLLNMGSITIDSNSINRKFKKLSKLPNKKVLVDYQHEQTPRSKVTSTSRREEQQTRPINTAASVI